MATFKEPLLSEKFCIKTSIHLVYINIASLSSQNITFIIEIVPERLSNSPNEECFPNIFVCLNYLTLFCFHCRHPSLDIACLGRGGFHPSSWVYSSGRTDCCSGQEGSRYVAKMTPNVTGFMVMHSLVQRVKMDTIVSWLLKNRTGIRFFLVLEGIPPFSLFHPWTCVSSLIEEN